jgi:hypothetical protein
MTRYPKTALLAAMALAAGFSLPATAQVTHETKVSTDVSHQDGVTTRTTKVAHIRKVKTHRPKRILGVKVGHKTRTTKTVRTTTVSSNGDYSRSVTTSH